jgi:methylated-DNA-[protein]-cysteine S-methyltransferase
VSIRHTTADTPLGPLTITARDNAITGVYFPHHWYPPTTDSLGEEVVGDELLDTAAGQLNAYLRGERLDFDLPTAAEGDDLQTTVWAILTEIPYGQTTTYGEIAGLLGDKKLAQLVGQAVGHNPLSIIVPCHRVVGANGKLTGYAGGIGRKQRLLELERSVPADALF